MIIIIFTFPSAHVCYLAAISLALCVARVALAAKLMVSQSVSRPEERGGGGGRPSPSPSRCIRKEKPHAFLVAGMARCLACVHVSRTLVCQTLVHSQRNWRN